MLINLKLYSPRWGHDDVYVVSLTKNKFELQLNSKVATCEIDENGETEWSGHREGSGNPMLNILDDDEIYAPAIVPELIEWILGQYRDLSVSDTDASSSIQDLFEWINITTKAKPKTPVLAGYWG